MNYIEANNYLKEIEEIGEKTILDSFFKQHYDMQVYEVTGTYLVPFEEKKLIL